MRKLVIVSGAVACAVLLGWGTLRGLFDAPELLRAAPLAASLPEVNGQWIWSTTDAAAFAAARAEQPALVPAVFVANIDGNAAWHRRLPPRVAGDRAAVVVRIDDAFHAAWQGAAEGTVAQRLAEPLAAILREVRATGVEFTEVQLDYDVPVRRLAAWGAVVRRLGDGPLRGVPVWITTVPAHLESPDFAPAFRGVVTGHVIQTFDTGLPCDAETVEVLTKNLRQQGLSFRAGFGAFERAATPADPPATAHGCWLDAASRLRRVPGYSGAWVFGAARRTAPAFERLARRAEGEPS